MSTYAKILLAEDEVCGAHYLKQLLNHMGYDVSGVIHAGEDVIDSVAKELPDLILMDISLGGEIDGINAAEKIHARFDIPVIYLTAHTDDDVFERAKVTEPYAYLVKPYDISQLHHAIEIALFKHNFEKRLKESENRYRTIFDVSDNAMMMIDEDHIISMVNEEFERMMGCPRESVEKKKRWSDFFADNERIKIEECLHHAGNEACNIQRHFEAILVDAAGTTRIVYTNVKKIPGGNSYIISMNDISDLKLAEKEIRQLNNELNKANRGLKQEIVLREKVEKQLRHKANHDHLTGLPNRVLLFDRLKQAFAFEERHKTLLALMILDLDNFKNINDTMGHLSGDILLKKVALGLQKCMRQYDTVGRIGGDEFVIIVNDINTIQDIIKFSEKIQAIFQQPFDILGQPLYVTTSIGVAVYPLHGSNIEILLKKADMAMYAAKKDGRNTFRFFSDSMNFMENNQKNIKTNRRITRTEGANIRNFLSNVDAKTEKDQLTH